MDLQDVLAKKISDELNLNQDQYEIIRYGAFALIQIIISIIAVAFLGFIFGVMLQALIVSFSTSILRQYSGGVHAGKPVSCLIIGTAISLAIAVFIEYISYYLSFVYLTVILPMIYLISFYTVYKKAPVDSHAKPIESEIKRRKMKTASYIVLSVYFFINISFLLLYLYTDNTSFIEYSLDINGGMLFQIFSLTIMGHRFLGKIDNRLTNILYRR